MKPPPLPLPLLGEFTRGGLFLTLFVAGEKKADVVRALVIPDDDDLSPVEFFVDASPLSLTDVEVTRESTL